jgi:hypothetical protein
MDAPEPRNLQQTAPGFIVTQHFLIVFQRSNIEPIAAWSDALCRTLSGLRGSQLKNQMEPKMRNIVELAFLSLAFVFGTMTVVAINP